MPAKSQAQRAYLNANMGHAWVKKHHFDNKGKLPAQVGAKPDNDRPVKAKPIGQTCQNCDAAVKKCKCGVN